MQILLLGLAILLPAVARAQARCPWINEATARGALGGPVIVAVNVSDEGAGECTFSRKQQNATLQLRISVTIMSDVQKQFPAFLKECPAKNVPLQAIGNQAVTCSVRSKEHYFEERVVARVRNQAFVVSVSSTASNTPPMNKSMRREKANLIAELVAGNLF
jgi:hypothetical protein